MAIAEVKGFRLSPVVTAIAAHIFAIIAVTLMFVWLFHYRGGFNLDSSNDQHIFNVHPFLTYIGFTFVAGEAIMAYKLVPANHDVQKMFHSFFTLLAFVLGIVGVYAVFKFHSHIHVAHMNTLHGWIGMGILCIFGFQWLLGFLAFWYPKAPLASRAKFVPLHAFSGLLIFLLLIVTVQMGIAEEFIFAGLGRGKQARVLNFTGVMSILYALAVALTVILPK